MAYLQHEIAEENIREGTFDWRIEKFGECIDKNKKSPKFKLGRGNCLLRIFGRNVSSANTNSCFHVYLVSFDYNTLNDKTFYKLSLIALGKKFLLTKRTPLVKGLICMPLTIIEDNESSRADFSEDTVTLRLSWYEKKDCTVCERDTQTPLVLASEKESTKCLETLSKDFGRLYESKMDTDCVLKVGEAQFPVHRQVLSTRSEVFGAMFRHDTSESRSGVVDLHNVDGSVLGDVIHYIYTGQIRGLSPETAVSMYVAADKYALMELRGICLDLLKHSLTVQNVCKAALLAHTHGEMDLEKEIIVFIEEKLEELEETDDWQNFSKTKSILANKLLRSALLACKKKKCCVK